MFFDAFRNYGGPTQHQDNKNAVTADVLETGFIFAFALLGLCFFVILPGYRVGVIGQEWVSAEIETKTPYKAFTNTEITATIGTKIGLGSVNITLKGHPVNTVVFEHHGNTTMKWMERIDYNERFHWTWRQGRFGFGPLSGQIAQELRAAQFKGLPLPILWIAEYFVLDGELIRWGRSFRTAGWYTWQILWAAVPFWLLAIITSFQVLFYSGWFFMGTGCTMLISTIVYSSIRWGTQPLVIPFEDDVLRFHYGISFWLVVAGGIVSFLYGLIIVLMDRFAPQKIADFFNLDVLYDSEEYFHKKEEESPGATRQKTVTGAQKRIKNANLGPKSMRFRATARRIPRPNAKYSAHGGGGADNVAYVTSTSNINDTMV